MLIISYELLSEDQESQGKMPSSFNIQAALYTVNMLVGSEYVSLTEITASGPIRQAVVDNAVTNMNS